MADIVPPGSRLGRALDRAQAALAIPPRLIVPLVAISIGFRSDTGSRWTCRISLGHADDRSLYDNGALFVRVMLPFFIGLQIRWAGRDPREREFLQTHIGWRGNGVPAATFRIQSDRSGAEGHTDPNFGQAIGWADGTK
jgi:hypothetical protein